MPEVIPIGAILKELRARKGISLRKLGKEIGISFNTLNAYERNAIHPTLESSYKLARYFEVSIEYLIYGEKATQEFRDAELLALFHDVDALKKDDRSVIKRYIGKYVKTRTQLNELVREAEERPRSGRKKPGEKEKKNLNNA
jgi:transcriptional regulator with XRE-family HTH domain